MSKENIIVTAIIVVTVICAIIAIVHISKEVKRTVRKAQRTFSAASSFINQLNDQADILAETPKSVSGMTRIYEPQLLRDFPELNWKELKVNAEQQFKDALQAISEDNASPTNLSESLQFFVAGVVKHNTTSNISEKYSNVEIHQTEIAKYEKKNGMCILTLQSAVGYNYVKEQGGKLLAGDRERKTQEKYNIELMYVQDAKLANVDQSLGTVCPQCGAPVTNLGDKFCVYCGASITPINTQVWTIQRFYETDYYNA